MTLDLTRLEAFVEEWEQAHRMLGWDLWPTGYCGIASLLIAPALRVGWPEAQWTVHVGTYFPHGGRRAQRHAWVEGLQAVPGPQYIIVDPTRRQFGESLPLVVSSQSIDFARWDVKKALSSAEERAAVQSIRTHRTVTGQLTGGSMLKGIFEKFESART